MSAVAASSLDANAVSGFAGDARNLDALKRSAGRAPKDAVRQAATQFEALFMNMLMKSMRDSLPQEDPMSSSATRSYTGMLDMQLSQSLAGKGLGLADMMVKQLTRQGAAVDPSGLGATSGAAGAKAAPQAVRQELKKLQSATAEVTSAVRKGAGAPQDFVKSMMPHATEAARESGIPPHVMLGQAALESGWGKREIRAADGTPSHNLFGIKAGDSWKGRVVEATTTEYVNGVPRKQVERFRAYDSYADAFRDFGRLVGSNPRYAGAMQVADNTAAFAQRIQAAGYATDPNYAAKLTRTINHALQLQRMA